MTEYILAGDVGGTKTNVAICIQQKHEKKTCIAEERYLNCEYNGIEPIVRRFLHDHDTYNITRACFGVAGTVHKGACMMPNLGWKVEETSLADTTSLQQVTLINDLAATAYGISQLSADDVVTLNAGSVDTDGNIALIAAGTGLGEAILFKTEHGLHVSATEGGHASFAPENDNEADLWRYLASKFGHVSVERLVSGSGLYHIYTFLRDSGRYSETEPIQSEIATATDASASIAAHAKCKDSLLCEAALRYFVSIYGAEAGNLALKTLASGGLYVGGGIAPKIADALSDGLFITAFQNKGRFKQLLADIPVNIILEPKTALLGAAEYILPTKAHHSLD